MVSGENGAASIMHSLLRCLRSQHSLYSCGHPGICLFGTTNNLAFHLDPLLQALTIIPCSNHLFSCFSTIAATSGDILLGGQKTGDAEPVWICVSPNVVSPGDPSHEMTSE